MSKKTAANELEKALAFLRDPSGDGSTKVSHGFGGKLRPVGGEEMIPFFNHPMHIDMSSRDAQDCKHPIECVDVGSDRKPAACHSCGARLCRKCRVEIPRECRLCAQCADEAGP